MFARWSNMKKEHKWQLPHVEDTKAWSKHAFPPTHWSVSFFLYPSLPTLSSLTPSSVIWSWLSFKCLHVRKLATWFCALLWCQRLSVYTVSSKLLSVTRVGGGGGGGVFPFSHCHLNQNTWKMLASRRLSILLHWMNPYSLVNLLSLLLLTVT